MSEQPRSRDGLLTLALGIVYGATISSIAGWIAASLLGVLLGVLWAVLDFRAWTREGRP